MQDRFQATSDQVLARNILYLCYSGCGCDWINSIRYSTSETVEQASVYIHGSWQISGV